MERPVKHSEMADLLRRLNFKCVRTSGSHEQWEGTYDGQRRMVTLDKHHSPYHRGLLRDIRNQIGIAKADLFRLL